MSIFRNIDKEGLINRYKLSEQDVELSDVDLLLTITKKIGMQDDYERASNRIILDFRRGKLGRITLDALSDVDDNE